MDWRACYRKEQRMSIEDIANAVKESVTMSDLIDRYLSVTPHGHRIPCPIHNGVDYNFSYTDQGYKCFVCGASGDGISFVKGVCELPTRFDAMKKINADFCLNLPIGDTINQNLSDELERKRAERKRKEEEKEAWWNRYHTLMDKVILYGKVKQNADPMSDEYAEAVKNIDRVCYELDCLPPEPR